MKDYESETSESRVARGRSWVLPRYIFVLGFAVFLFDAAWPGLARAASFQFVNNSNYTVSISAQRGQCAPYAAALAPKTTSPKTKDNCAWTQVTASIASSLLGGGSLRPIQGSCTLNRNGKTGDSYIFRIYLTEGRSNGGGFGVSGEYAILEWDDDPRSFTDFRAEPCCNIVQVP
jgi:hypothetical protein